MNRSKISSLLRLLFTFLLISGCLFGYINVQSKEIIAFDEELAVVTKQEVAVEESVLEDESFVDEKTVETVVEDVEETIPVVATPITVSEPVITGDRIEIAGVTKHLKKDVEGNHFYLNHNLNGDYDGIGVPYVDYRYDFTGRKTIIYAHSMKSGNGPFQVLQNYHNNPSYYWNNRMITIYYQGNTYTYEIFSVYVSLADSEESKGLEYFHKDDYTMEEWEETLQYYKSLSEYDTGVSVNLNDKILILQTCSMDSNYYERYYRFNLLIMGRLVS